jgi:hypothetical protein
MQMGRALAAVSLALFAAPAVSLEPPINAGAAFLDAFKAACIPQRESFEGTKANAVVEGWVAVADDQHPELATLLEKSRAGMVDPEYPDWHGILAPYAKDVDGRPHHLIVLHFIAPGTANYVGCYLYDFDALDVIDPRLVTAFTGNPIAREIKQDGITSYLWGPPKGLLGTGDVYLTHITDGSPMVATTGFSGLVMKFDTYEPGSGEGE